MTKESKEVREEFIYVHCGLSLANYIEHPQGESDNTPSDYHLGYPHESASGAIRTTWVHGWDGRDQLE